MRVIEVERKYEVPVDFELPDLGDVDGSAGLTVDDPVTHRLTATYYDTERLTLAWLRHGKMRRSRKQLAAAPALADLALAGAAAQG